MQNKTQRFLSFKAMIGYIVLFLIVINQGISYMSNIDFVLSAQGNPRLVAVWDFFVSPKGNFIAIIIVAIYLTVLFFIPEKRQENTVDVNKEEDKENDLLRTNDNHSTTIPKGFELVRLEPDITCLAGKKVTAHKGENGIIIEGDDEKVESIITVILPYHNDPLKKRLKDQNKKIGVIDNVSAQISYRYFNGQSAFTIHRGAWLSEKENKVDFGINDKRNLIVAVVLPTQKKLFAVGRDFNSVHPNGITNYTELKGDVISVRTRLITESNGAKITELEHIIQVENEPKFKIEITPAGIWKWMRLAKLQIEGIELNNKLYEVEKQEEIIDEIRQWEKRTGDFIGKFLSERQKIRFINAYPSLDDGLRNAVNLTISLSGQTQPARPSRWTLNDSIKVRTDLLNEYKGRPI